VPIALNGLLHLRGLPVKRLRRGCRPIGPEEALWLGTALGELAQQSGVRWARSSNEMG
jgi:hypothetical protein